MTARRLITGAIAMLVGASAASADYDNAKPWLAQIQVSKGEFDASMKYIGPTLTARRLDAIGNERLLVSL
jgi:hypothetical protein